MLLPPFLSVSLSIFLSFVFLCLPVWYHTFKKRLRGASWHLGISEPFLHSGSLSIVLCIASQYIRKKNTGGLLTTWYTINGWIKTCLFKKHWLDIASLVIGYVKPISLAVRSRPILDTNQSGWRCGNRVHLAGVDGYWLVVSNMTLFSIIYGIILPID